MKIHILLEQPSEAAACVIGAYSTFEKAECARIECLRYAKGSGTTCFVDVDGVEHPNWEVDYVIESVDLDACEVRP